MKLEMYLADVDIVRLDKHRHVIKTNRATDQKQKAIQQYIYKNKKTKQNKIETGGCILYTFCITV